MIQEKGSSRKTKSATILTGLLIAFVGFGIGTAQAQEKKPAPKPGLPDHVAALGRKLYGLDIDDAKPITDEIQKLVVGHLNTWFANRTPNIIEVRHELEQAPRQGETLTQAAARLAGLSGWPRRKIYRMATESPDSRRL